MNVIGITGNTGSGKTYISNILKESGSYIIDADKIYYKNLLKNECMIKELISFFGEEILNKDKIIDRSILRKIVFSNKKKLQLLNKITHKYIIFDIKYEINKNKKYYDYIILDAPLLIETNLHKLCDEIWLVYADLDVRVNRIMKRDNITKKDALNRIKNQTKFENLKFYADKIIDNNVIEIIELKNYIISLLINK